MTVYKMLIFTESISCNKFFLFVFFPFCSGWGENHFLVLANDEIVCWIGANSKFIVLLNLPAIFMVFLDIFLLINM